MSYSEKLCEKSLRMIFYKDIKIFKNYRPEWLKNPKTGRNLEIDFYLPHIKVAFEIQGPHHYDDFNQIENDYIKEKLLEKNKITLIKLSIFQISPSLIRKKIINYTNLHHTYTLLKKHDNNWTKSQEIKDYKEKILNKYGKSKCSVSPYINEDKRLRKLKIKLLDEKIMSTIEFKYKFNNSGIIERITPIEILPSNGVKCRILGSNKFIIVSKKHLIDI